MLTDASVETSLLTAITFMLAPVYKGRKAPIDVMVYDPVRLPAAEFELKMVDSTNSAIH
jgi:hypothetical protein